MWTKVVLAACMTTGLAMSQGLGSYLGVGIQEIDSNRAKELKLPEEAGVEVTRIAPDSPAEKAGIKTGDAVMEYNGQRVEGMDQFSRLVRETPAGREVKIGIIRNGAPQTIAVKIVARPAMSGQLIPAPVQEPLEFRFPDMPQNHMTWRSAMLGIEAEALDGQLAEFFGVKEGVLVRAVTKGLAADKAGIKAGDVIVRVDDAKVATPADISAHLRALRGRPVSVVVVRDRKEVNVMLSVIRRPERSVGAVLWPMLPWTDIPQQARVWP
ncbi:MAG: PDZ domain-containing protein [Acidobacteriia bacterium]|nr:PDZ domain-containing protein [Terriglobia bacterium]